MLNALSAESLKMRRHRAAWFLVWIYPIVFTAVMLIAIGAGIGGFDPPARETLQSWLENTAIIWILPGNSFGRYLIAAFVAVMFAGEYGWNTWKLIVPHRSRTTLIAAKYATAVLLFLATFALTAILTTILTFADDLLTGDTIPAGVTAGAILDIQFRVALAALPPLLLTIAIASLAAVLTRSMVAALVVSVVVITIEQLIFTLGPVMSIRFPGLVSVLYPTLPGHHLSNLFEWIVEGKVVSRPFPNGTVVAYAWTTSLAVVAAWTAALVAATFAVFKRQDIN
jgi:ABC-type transport system involved in multi-copper enzyme maturation permease subunit